jgi:hypothetical protein
MDIHKEIREQLVDFSQDLVYGEEYYSDNIFKIIESSEILNLKGLDFNMRFRDIISDPNNLFIKRVENAGEITDGVITLHNGIKVHNNCYYDDFTNILILNKGVHEPSEERTFEKVLKNIREDSVMLELGSYWSFYSIWFLKEKQKGKSYCIECDEQFLQQGINNFKLNNVVGNFTKGFVGNSGINLSNFISENNLEYIDILHSDIQGYELEMLHQIEKLLLNKKIKYLLISTHSDKIHYDCINFLSTSGYRIVTCCDYESETFQYDGFILSCPNDIDEIEKFSIGNRSKSKLISLQNFENIKKYYNIL